MTEFSESAHLRSEKTEDAVELLRRAKVAGYVFPSRNGWVSFVYDQNDDTRFKVEDANKGLLVHYDYANDHGCWVTVHQGRKPVARIKASFDRPNAAFDRATFEKLAILSPGGAQAVDAWVKRAHVWHERSRAPHLVAERLGLLRYRWFSYRGEQTIERPDPARIHVFADGKVKRPPAPPKPHTAAASPPKKKAKAKAKAKAAPKKKKKARR